MQDVDVSKLAHNKYQAIVLPVKVSSSGGHVESILTDGKFLFWLNRGFGFIDPGIKVFKIIHNISHVQNVLYELKEGKSQTDTRQAIYSLLREEGDEYVPEHILVPMKPQLIGNCGWVQIESMLYALGIVGYMGDLQKLPDVQSPEWQQILKNADDVYNDFIIFDRIARAEAVLYAIDKNFIPQVLDNIWQQKIDDMRQFVAEPVAHELLLELVYKLEDTASNYIGTIYEDQYNIVLRKLQLEEALASEMGLALQTAVDDYSIAKQLLAEYQSAYLGDFYDLQQIYTAIKDSSINLYDVKYNLLKALLHFIVKQPVDLLNISELVEVLSISIPECIAKKAVNDEYCILEAFAEKSTATITDEMGVCINIHADEFSLLMGVELFTDNPIYLHD